MKKQFYAGAAAVAFFSPSVVFAQSTGSIEVEDEIVVVARSEEDGINGVVIPDAQKPRAVLTEELIQKQGSGQSILNTINQVPGVNFTNSDAYGSSGGNLRIRGFDGNRISLTFDGFPLNDTGNYAIFSNQQLDPELIRSVNVNLGTTDVDSPTASAAGGTVNYLTRDPQKKMGGLLVFSAGENDFVRGFAKFETGELTKFGTAAWFSASFAQNDKFKGPGKIDKQQYNFRIRQPLGSNGDFIAITGHYNQNRNNFYRNPSLTDLRTITGRTAMVDADGFTKAQQKNIFLFDNLATCNKTLPGAGIQNDNGGTGPSGTGAAAAGGTNNVLNTSSCTNFFGLRINPSNTGNVHINSRFTLTDKLRLTFDAGWFYVLANGGGTTTIGENNVIVRGASGLAGKDLNGDGDIVDTLRFYTPNTTNTRRWIVSSSLIYDLNDDHRLRIAYTFDRGRHRQTGEWGYLDAQGNPENVFGGRNGRPVLSADGVPLRQRDRLSIAMLNQIAGEYRGQFFDDKLTVSLGLRMPFFKRELNNFCYAQAAANNATCTTQVLGTVAAAGTTYLVPDNFIVTPTTVGTPVFRKFSATYKFSPVLPNLGFTFKVAKDLTIFGSYARGFSAPRTDNLYRAPIVNVDPETTDTIDLGVRYTTPRFQAQATVWNTQFKNRIVQSFDQNQGISVDRNIGTVKGQGFDIGIAARPYKWFTFQGNLSYNNSKLKDDIQIGTGLFLPTKGKRVAETPEWIAGYRAEVEFGPVEIGLQVRYVSDRFATDLNDINSGSYTLADLDARVNLKKFGLGNSWLQVNVSNLFNRFYLGNITTTIAGANNNGLVLVPGVGAGAPIPGGGAPSWSVGAPRTISATIRIGF